MFMSAKATYLSPTPEDTDIRTGMVGARLLGTDLLPQGEEVNRVLSAREDGLPLFTTVAVQMPRRSAKTTSIWSYLLGRCLVDPGTLVVATAQDGTRARRKFREVARTIERRLEALGQKGGRIYYSNGDERIEFHNGSRLWVVAPRAEAFRSEAADIILLDEAGELDLDRSEELMEGALPLTDTRPMGQVIIAGTPAKVRAGLLWQTLEEGREGVPGTGVIDYSIRDDEEVVRVAEDGSLHLDEEVARRVHPGVGTLTTMAKMQARLHRMGQVSYEREYAGRFPFDASTSAIDMEAWRTAEVPALSRPETFGLAFDCAPDSSSAAVMAAWRDAEGLLYVGVLEHRTGTAWVAREVHRLATTYRVPVRFDSIGANHAPATELGRMKGVRLVPGTSRDAMGSVATITEALRTGTLRHFGQASLNTAAEGAAFRQGEGGRYWARKASVNDITPLVGAGLAAWQFDTMKPRALRTIRSTAS